MSNTDTDRITGKSFATHYACLLTEGAKYAATFDATPRTLVRKAEHPNKPDMMCLIWDNTPKGKMQVVPMGKRYFIR